MLKRYGGVIVWCVLLVLTALVVPSNTVVFVSNLFFLVGLAGLVCFAGLVLLNGHLFTGWRRFHRRGDDAETAGERVPARQVGRIKNAPIKVHRFAWWVLQFALPLVLISILMTL